MIHSQNNTKQYKTIQRTLETLYEYLTETLTYCWYRNPILVIQFRLKTWIVNKLIPMNVTLNLRQLHTQYMFTFQVKEYRNNTGKQNNTIQVKSI